MKRRPDYTIYIKNVYIYMFPFFTLPGSRKDRHQDGSSTVKGEANDYKRKKQNGKAMLNIELLHVLK